MNDASTVPIADVLDAQTEPDSELGSGSRLALYFAVGLGAGSVIALQIDVMRVFSVGSWAHFGSLVVSLAMLGFGLASAVMTVAKDWFARNWRGAATVSLALFGPLAVAANLYVQHLGFNAIFLISDPAQKWKLLAIFLAELTPFLAGAFFLPRCFPRPRRGRTLWSRFPFGDVCVPARQFDRCAVGPLVCRLPGLGVWPRRSLDAHSIPSFRRACFCRPFCAAADGRPEDARDERLQGRGVRAQIPGREKGLRERLAVRLSRGLLEFLPAFCTGPIR